MTEKPMEGGQDSGEKELPKPSYQEQPVDQQPSGANAQAAFDPEKLSSLIEETVERKLQSQKDRRWNDLEKKYGDLSEIGQMLADVKGGKDPDEIMRALELKSIKDELAALKNVPQKVAIPGKSEADEAYAKAKDIISKAGLNNNPRILEAMSGTYTNPAEMLTKVTLEVLDVTAGKPQPSTASQITPGGGGKPATQQQGQQLFDETIGSLTKTGGVDINALREAADKLE